MKPINRIDKYLQSEYYSCTELQAVGGKATHTIRDFCEEIFKEGGAKPVLPFQSPTAPKLVMNRTRLRDTAKVLGPDASEWGGATIHLSLDILKNGGNTIKVSVENPLNVVTDSSWKSDPF